LSEALELLLDAGVHVFEQLVDPLLFACEFLVDVQTALETVGVVGVALHEQGAVAVRLDYVFQVLEQEDCVLVESGSAFFLHVFHERREEGEGVLALGVLNRLDEVPDLNPPLPFLVHLQKGRLNRVQVLDVHLVCLHVVVDAHLLGRGGVRGVLLGQHCFDVQFVLGVAGDVHQFGSC